MNLNQTDIIVSDVVVTTELVEKILHLTADYADDNFAQFTVGRHCLMFSKNHLVPMLPIQSGMILHIEVDDILAELRRLELAGIVILNAPTKTDWGTYSLMVGGPEQIVFDFYERL